MKSIEVDLSGISTLGELFAAWQEMQEQNGLNEQKCAKSVKESTFPDCKCSGGRVSEHHSDFYKSFCYDGFITDWQGGRKTILFICREANIADEKHIYKKMLLPETTPEGNCPDCFWMKKHFFGWAKNHCIEDSSNDAYIEFVRQRVSEYGGLERLNVAYMNLNKRGGFGNCNMARIGHYVKSYQSYICKEIELINPDIIICGGTFDTVKGLIAADHFRLLKDMGKEEIICRDFCHPAARGGIREKKENAIDLVLG